MTGVGVTCRGLVHIYPSVDADVVALGGVDLDIDPGETVALLGPSGCGKSTLLSILAGLLAPSAGRVRVGEQDLVRAGAAELALLRATDVGVVLQGASRNLLPYLDALDNVAFAQRGAARDRAELPDPTTLLDLVGIAKDERRAPLSTLSPGARQRVATATAVANGAGLLLADEVTSQLDAAARDGVLAALGTLNAETGTTIVVVTHDDHVSAAFRRTVTMRDGRVGAEGRRGEDFAVIGRDGSLHLPPAVMEAVPPGTLLRVTVGEDGVIRAEPVRDAG